MTPINPRAPENQNRVYNRLLTLYQCALALLVYEKSKRKLIDNKVSQLKLLTCSGDKKILSPEEKEKLRRNYPRIPPPNIPKL